MAAKEKAKGEWHGRTGRFAIGNHDSPRPDAQRGGAAEPHQPADYAVRKKSEKKTKRHPLLYAVLGFLIAFTLITSTPLKVVTYPLTIPFFAMGGMELQLTVWNVVNLAVSAVIGAIL